MSSALRSSAKVSVAILASRVLGVVRDSIFARVFGVSGLTDAYVAAFRIPNLLRDLFAEGALSSAFVPTFSDALTKGGRERAFRLGNLVLGGVLAGTGGLPGGREAGLWIRDHVPQGGTFLQDWILFVSVVVPTSQNAHRFSVVVPVQLSDDATTQAVRRDLAQRIAQQEKPAHTDFDVKLYWAAFCAGESRVGIETVVGPSSRFAALLLGQGSLASSYLGYVEPWNVRGRMVAGRDRLKQQTGIRCGGSSR